MHARGCDADVAFEILKAQSQAENRKIRAIAAEIVERQGRRAGSAGHGLSV